MRYLTRLYLPCLLAATLAASSPAGAQTVIPTPPRADSAALDSLRVELVRSRGFLRGAETQLSKVLAQLDSLRARVPAPSEPAPPDTVWLPSPPDTVVVRDTVWVEVPVPVDPDPIEEPEPVDPDPAEPIGRVVAIDLDPASGWTMQVGDTVTLRVTGGTSELPDGANRPATHEELEAAGLTWTYSGGYAIPTAETGDLSARVYGSRVGRSRIDVRLPDVAVVAGQRWVTVVERDPTDPLPPEPEEPDPIEEPVEPPVLEPCDDCPEPPPLAVGDSLAVALEFDGATIHEAGISYRPEPLPSYACARLLSGVRATVDGDTIRVEQDSTAAETLWCIPYNWPAITEGDPQRARTYPAEPHGGHAWYREP